MTAGSVSVGTDDGRVRGEAELRAPGPQLARRTDPGANLNYIDIGDTA